MIALAAKSSPPSTKKTSATAEAARRRRRSRSRATASTAPGATGGSGTRSSRSTCAEAEQPHEREAAVAVERREGEVGAGEPPRGQRAWLTAAGIATGSPLAAEAVAASITATQRTPSAAGARSGDRAAEAAVDERARRADVVVEAGAAAQVERQRQPAADARRGGGALGRDERLRALALEVERERAVLAGEPHAERLARPPRQPPVAAEGADDAVGEPHRTLTSRSTPLSSRPIRANTSTGSRRHQRQREREPVRELAVEVAAALAGVGPGRRVGLEAVAAVLDGAVAASARRTGRRGRRP